MDDSTFKRHLRLSRSQFDQLLFLIQQDSNSEADITQCGRPRISVERQLLMVLCYLANDNSFREISDKFAVTQSCAYRVIVRMLNAINRLAPLFIKHWNDADKMTNSEKFQALTGLCNVIGAIDGCHIRITRPPKHGDDYLNRKGYYSILLQGVCDHEGIFRDIFVGPPGRIHDARLLRTSPLFQQVASCFGNHWKLLGDSAYVCNDFQFIRTPKRDNGLLTEHDRECNTRLSRGRVIIENTFGRLKCRFRRLRDVQNVNLANIVNVVVAACVLHNFTNGNYHCADHPHDCPRCDDAND